MPVIIPLTSNVPANPQLPAPDGDFRAGVSAQAGSQGSTSPVAGAQDGLGGPGAIRRAAGESLAGLKAAFWAGVPACSGPPRPPADLQQGWRRESIFTFS